MKRLVLAVGLVGGCSPTAYAEAVTVYPVTKRPGRFTVEAAGNRRTSPGLLRSYIERRAGELCSEGYDIDNTTDAAETRSRLVNGQIQSSTSHEVTATVVCKVDHPDPSDSDSGSTNDEDQ